jgi:hypothetical protein
MNSHLTEDQISEWIAGGRSREAEQHLHDCPECTAQIGATQKSLLLFRDSGYQAADYWQRQPSQSPRALRLLSGRSLSGWIPAAAAVALAIVAAVALYRPSRPEPPSTQEVFLKIPYVIPPAPYERTQVVRMDVPVAALIQAGFTMNAAAADSVSADVLIGQDGRPLAVAFSENRPQ